MRRRGQDGSVFQKGRKHNEEWLSDKPAYLRFWRDIPGHLEPKREVIPLGICRTRTIAERNASEKLEQRGVNSAQRFVETTSTTTFKRQGEQWLKSLAARKRNPLEQTTIDTRRYALDKWVYPFLGNHTQSDG